MLKTKRLLFLLNFLLVVPSLAEAQPRTILVEFFTSADSLSEEGVASRFLEAWESLPNEMIMVVKGSERAAMQFIDSRVLEMVNGKKMLGMTNVFPFSPVSLIYGVDYRNNGISGDSELFREFADRQRLLALSLQNPILYTPQIIVQGQETYLWSDQFNLEEAIEGMFETEVKGQKWLMRANDEQDTSFVLPCDESRNKSYTIHLLAGHHIPEQGLERMAAAAQDWNILGGWNGCDPAEFEVKSSDFSVNKLPMAAIAAIQEDGFGQVIAAHPFGLTDSDITLSLHKHGEH